MPNSRPRSKYRLKLVTPCKLDFSRDSKVHLHAYVDPEYPGYLFFAVNLNSPIPAEKIRHTLGAKYTKALYTHREEQRAHRDKTILKLTTAKGLPSKTRIAQAMKISRHVVGRSLNRSRGNA